MANVRDSDTSLWLHNKLGTSNDSWTGGSICSQLNAEVLRNIKDCFPDLQTQVKLKLLLSFFHIPRRNIEEWRIELEQIIDVAVSDSELWVSMLAEALKTFPATGSLNTEISDLDDVRPIFTDLVNDLKRLVKKQAEQVMLPMECHYLNKIALVSVVGQQPAPTKHFTLRKKPKSALLRVDLLQKSSDAASNLKKASAPVIPVRSRGMPRKMTDTTPLKGIPSRVPSGGFRAGALNNSATRPPAAMARPTAGRKEGGVKLLDIADQPLGYAAAKKRKKMQEMEDAAAVAAANAAAAAAAAATAAATATSIKKDPTIAGAQTADTTPDYALGLTTPSYAPATPQPTVPPTVSTLVSPPTPASVAPPTPAPTQQPSSPALPTTPTTTIITQQPPAAAPTPTQPTIITQTPTPLPQQPTIIKSTNPTPLTIVTSKAAAQQLLLAQQQQLQQGGNILSAITVPAATAAAAVAAGAKLVSMPSGTVLTATKQQLAMAGLSAKTPGITPGSTTATIIRQIPVSMATGAGTQTVVRPVPPLLATSGAAVGQVLTGTAQNQVVVTRPVQQVTQIRLQPQPAAALQRRGLALTRDQMIEAQEMFRTANKVTRPEKALILGFMAGSRDNPCPHLGNIVTIKLSEDQENVMQTDNTFLSMLVETHFQMNYNNGEWKRIKKYRHMESNIDQLQAGGGQQTAAGLV